MNKLFVNYYESIGLLFDGKKAYGTYKGYDICFVEIPLYSGYFPNTMSISCYLTGEQRNQMINFLNSYKKMYFKFEIKSFGIVISQQGLTNKKILEELKRKLEDIVTFLASINVKGTGYCPYCGKEINDENSSLRKVEVFNIKACNDCVNILNEAVKIENENFDKQPNNYFLGFIGALIGGIIGGILMIIIASLGFVSVWTTIGSMFIAYFLYKAFKGKEDNKMVLIISLTVFVCNVVFFIYMYGTSFMYLAEQEGLTYNITEAYKWAMQISEYSSEFIRAGIYSLLFTALGIFALYGYLKNKAKRKEEIK